MLNALNKLWTEVFVAVLLLPVAGVISGLIGPQNGLTFWIMGMAAHWPMLSVTNLLVRRRLAIWLTAIAVGVITAVGLQTITIIFLSVIPAEDLLTLAAGHLSSAFWLGVALRSAPVAIAWTVSGVLVRRSSRGRQVASPSTTIRQSTQDLQTQITGTGEDVQNVSQIYTGGASAGDLPLRASAVQTSMNRGSRVAAFVLAVVAVGLVAFFVEHLGGPLAGLVEHRHWQPPPTGPTLSRDNPYNILDRADADQERQLRQAGNAATISPDNPFLALDAQDESEQQQFRTATKAAAQTTPDRRAEALKLSLRTGVPTSVIEDSFDEIKAHAQIADTPYAQMQRESPVVAQRSTSTNPDHAAVAVLPIDGLIAEYLENEFAAAAKYENAEPLRTQCLTSTLDASGCRVVEIAGTIREMGYEFNGPAYINLATRDQAVSVEARIDNPKQEALQTLRRGQRVSVRCMVAGYNRPLGLSLTRCVVAP